MTDELKTTEINEEQIVASDWYKSQVTGYQFHPPKTICRCDLFGQGQLVISFYEGDEFGCPIPNRWVRFWASVFFNSKWNFVTDD